ncbi:GNAT family N-acetyltransferase [Fuerstiella marisgermanici]|uniref:Putative N-acetyltransferase YafP n=1 Tax=Fuerstiella marisgermanici TaxID=1891926 RepID=A0A1P8WJG4_9PLAN|nr:GNAT family N-acetyltransferase [Fuerstiella marisgermanici]APZ94206.1 putative N-acetyltransferase YafP [Fuerstiella marisgermanici]
MHEKNQIEIRSATVADYDALADVMFDAVRHGPSAYTEEQRQAWVPQPRRGVDWVERLSSQSIFVAANSSEVVGFMSLAEAGYIDFAYIRPSAQGTGVFRRLYESIEKLSQQNGETRLWVHASLMAQPAFAAMGFAIKKKEVVQIGEQSLDRFEMEKRIGIH